MDFKNDIPELLGQVLLVLNAHQHDMSLSSLRTSVARTYDLRATLCEQINARTLVNKLPNELLLEVFKHTLHKDEPCPTVCLDVSENARVQTGPLLWLTHVCRRWRNIALGHPLLWQRIDAHNAEQLLEFALQRSSPGPFSLFVNYPKHIELDDQDALRFVLLYSDRLRRLDLAYGDTCYHDYLHYLLLHILCPNLECLTVTNYPPAAMLQGRDPPIVVSQEELYRGDLARLRALAISPIADWLPANPLPALTHLFLGFRWICDLRTPVILSMLATAPLLEMVHLSGYTLPPDAEPSEHAPVHLPHLKHILFSDKSHLPSALALLNQLVVPPSARTFLDCVSVHSRTASSILPILPSTAGTDHLTLVTEETTLQLIASGRAADSAFWLSAHESAQSNEDEFATWLTHLPAMFPLAHLTSLQIRLDMNHHGSTITRILRACPRLASLEIMFCLFFGGNAEPEPDGAENSLAHVCHSLSLSGRRSVPNVVTNTSTSSVQDPPWAPEPEPQLCPALHTLTIALESDDGAAVADYTRWLALIRAMVHARANIRHPIRRLAVQPMHYAHRIGAPGYVVHAVHDAYASLATAPGVEEFVLHRPKEEPIFAKHAAAVWDWDWGEVERYWTVAEDDRPRFWYPWDNY